MTRDAVCVDDHLRIAVFEEDALAELRAFKLSFQ
jgi:hypothetical protein